MHDRKRLFTLTVANLAKANPTATAMGMICGLGTFKSALGYVAPVVPVGGL